MTGFKAILKFLSEVLGIVIVIAAIIVFSYFDPFGWFEPKAKIDSTAILVREVKQIGELITAEYYGEAITSWPATVAANAFDDDTMEIKRIVFGIYNDFQKLNRDRDADEWSENRRMRYYRNHLKEKYTSSPLYLLVMQTISEVGLKPNEKSQFKNKSWRMEERAIGLMYEKAPEEIMSVINLQKISETATHQILKESAKKDAACIGRGIVRAGFDFSKLTSSDIHASNVSKTIFVTNATPKILSIELNPWFIPQRKVKGFEILKLHGKINEKDIRQLKARCKEMIRQQAIQRKIVEEAKRNGEEALLNFFNLVSSEPIDRVVIVSDYLDEMHFLYDTLTVFSPAQALDIYNKSIWYLRDSSYYEPQPDSLKTFLKGLKIRKSKIDYALGIKDSLTQTIDKKVVPFSLKEVEAIRIKGLALDTARIIKNKTWVGWFEKTYWENL